MAEISAIRAKSPTTVDLSAVTAGRRRSSRISLKSVQSNQFSIPSSFSSLDLRKLPVDCLLVPPEPPIDEIPTEKATKDRNEDNFLCRTCINSRYSLKTQLILTFGTINTLTIMLVTAVCISVAILSFNSVKGITYRNYDTMAKETRGTTARLLAESLSSQLIPKDIVEMLAGAVQDRFMGYPNHRGYDEDELVPFWDIESKSNKYPIIGKSLPLDWQIESNVHDGNYLEHVQNRWSWYNRNISTKTATYYMQGMCDPTVADPKSSTYFPFCTEHNNNVKTGGVVAATQTNYQIHRKASDLTPLLKALYEYHQEVFSLGVYFSNGGSGATIFYPQMELNTNTHYESIGCSWLLETPNPYDESRPIFADPLWHKNGKYETVCRPNGVNVSSRMYNPLERAWCRDQAINPHKVHVTGPYIGAFSSDVPFITVGKAIYDKLTSEFIGCIAIDFSFNSIKQILEKSRLRRNAQVSLVRYDSKGVVLASTALKISSATTTTTIDAIGAGVRKSDYQALWSLVNYSNYADGNVLWNATDIRKTYENFLCPTIENRHHLAAYPIPPPPDTYDPMYAPEFMIIVTEPKAEMNKEVDSLIDEFNHEVDQVVFLSVVAGLVGVVIIIIAIVLVSHILTPPLQYINEVANDIINKNFGDDHSKDTDLGREKWNDVAIDKNTNTKNEKTSDSHDHQFHQSRWLPRTELNEVAEKFREMVSHFSSKSMAKSMQVDIKAFELKNGFSMVRDFKDLYMSRDDEPTKDVDRFQYNFEYSAHSNNCLELLHHGTNAEPRDTKPSLQSKSDNRSSIIEKDKSLSSLFFWIVALTVMPFLVSTAGISGIVAATSFHECTGIINDLKINFVDYKIDALHIYANHRAHLTSVFIERPIRDLHVLTRYAGWLLFGGITRTDSFTDIVSNIEKCRFFENITQCEEYIGTPLICDCAWGDTRRSCQHYGKIDTRYSQKPFFVSQSQDTWPNGDRNFTTYPNVSTSPQSTEWWDDVTTLPGSQEDSLTSDYNSTYARVRILSSLPVLQVLFNKDKESRVHLGSYIGFEADGTFMGYEGCAYPAHERLSHFKMSSGNSRLPEELCPVGKFGYDPRCREWYANGKSLYMSNKRFVHVAPPYDFAGMDFTGQSCTSPLVDPTTGEHIGQTMIDFTMTPIHTFLSSQQTPLHERGFPFIISASSEVQMKDTVMGPGFVTENPQPIADAIFANDPICSDDENCKGRQNFQLIVDEMKAGKTGTAEFSRTSPDGFVEKLYTAYAPVIARSSRPLDSSDFSRGLESSKHIIYSLALAVTEDSLLRQSNEMERQFNLVIIIAVIVLILVLSAASSCVIYFSYRMAQSMSELMLNLLNLIEYINRLESYDDTPDIDVYRRGHSLEILNVAKTIESLYQVTRSANVAFFAGDIEHAYKVLSDVLEVYRGLKNEKGISIACNNLGNLMLIVYREMQASGDFHLCDFTEEQVIAMGLRYFHEAIQLGEKGYDTFIKDQGWSPVCLEFMQHLSHRYFNRAMFILTVKDSHEKPTEIEKLGLRDLQITNDMDLEIVEEGTNVGWDVRTIDMLFDVTLGRVRGHLSLQEMGYEDEEYEMEEKLDEAFKTILKELKERPRSSLLFEDVSVAGRMQQIETELMRYKMLKGDIRTAAQIAIRMLVEDEYVFLHAQNKAMEVLVDYANSGESHQGNPKIDSGLLRYQNQLKRNGTLLMKRFKEKSEISLRTSLSSRPSLMQESSKGDFTMEIF